MSKLDSLIERFNNWSEIAETKKNHAISLDRFALAEVLRDLALVKNEFISQEKRHMIELFKAGNFVDDEEKMKDFRLMAKEEFLLSYGYLTEDEYDNTERIVKAVLDVYEN